MILYDMISEHIAFAILNRVLPPILDVLNTVVVVVVAVLWRLCLLGAPAAKGQ